MSTWLAVSVGFLLLLGHQLRLTVYLVMPHAKTLFYRVLVLSTQFIIISATAPAPYYWLVHQRLEPHCGPVYIIRIPFRWVHMQSGVLCTDERIVIIRIRGMKFLTQAIIGLKVIDVDYIAV